jgi:hypothetical protein
LSWSFLRAIADRVPIKITCNGKVVEEGGSWNREVLEAANLKARARGISLNQFACGLIRADCPAWPIPPRKRPATAL